MQTAVIRKLYFIWGMLGVLLWLGFAIERVTPYVMALELNTLSAVNWVSLILFSAFMVYSEGYKGFHLNFAPRVLIRALAMREKAPLWLLPLAPMIAIGYIYATRKRMLTSWVITLAIIVVVVAVRQMDPVWRGIIDTGVVCGLVLGWFSVAYYWLAYVLRGVIPKGSADLPDIRPVESP